VNQKELEMQRMEIQRLRQRVDQLERLKLASGKGVSKPPGPAVI
jgi:hypothetical protein